METDWTPVDYAVSGLLFFNFLLSNSLTLLLTKFHQSIGLMKRNIITMLSFSLVLALDWLVSSMVRLIQ